MKVIQQSCVMIYCKGCHSILQANKDELKARELFELEMNISQWINLGLINNYSDLKKALTKLYYQKYPNVLPL